MRYPNLSAGVALANGATYNVASLLTEWVFGSPYWTQNEATDAAFKRIRAALKVQPFALEDQDFEHACNVLRQYNFGEKAPMFAIELSEVRNLFIFSPREAPAKADTIPPSQPEAQPS